MFANLPKEHLAASHAQMFDFAHNEYMFHQYMCSGRSGILFLLGEVEKLVTWFLHLWKKEKADEKFVSINVLFAFSPPTSVVSSNEKLRFWQEYTLSLYVCS